MPAQPSSVSQAHEKSILGGRKFTSGLMGRSGGSSGRLPLSSCTRNSMRRASSHSLHGEVQGQWMWQGNRHMRMAHSDGRRVRHHYSHRGQSPSGARRDLHMRGRQAVPPACLTCRSPGPGRW